MSEIKLTKDDSLFYPLRFVALAVAKDSIRPFKIGVDMSSIVGFTGEDTYAITVPLNGYFKEEE